MSFFSAAGKLLEKAAVQLDKAAVSLDHAFDLPSSAANPPANPAAANNTSVPAPPVLVDSDLGIVWNASNPPPAPRLQTQPQQQSVPSRAASPSGSSSSAVTRESSSRLERRLGGLFRSESHIATTSVTVSNSAAADASAPISSHRTRSLSASPVRPEHIPLPPSPILAPCDSSGNGRSQARSLSAQPALQALPPATGSTGLPPQPLATEPDAVEPTQASRQLIRSLLAKVQAREATIAQLQAENAAFAAQREHDRRVEGAAINAELKRNQALHAQLDEANTTIHSLSARLSDTLGQWEANRRDFESRIALLQSELDAAHRSANLLAQNSGSSHVSFVPNNAPDPLATDLQQAVSFWAQKCGELERQLAASQSAAASLESKLQARLSNPPPTPPTPIVHIGTNGDELSGDASLVKTLQLRIQELEERLDQQHKSRTQVAERTATVTALPIVTPDATRASPAPTTPTSSLQTQMEIMRAVKEQLATQVMQLSRELAQLRTQYAELSAREDTLLELLGEREAEVEDLKEMLQDAKEAYKVQLESLMEAVGKNQ